MSLPKGRTNNPKGRTPGIKNQKTLEWEEFGKQLLEMGLPKMMTIMEKSNDRDFTGRFLMLLEYFKPKQSRTEVTGKDGKDLQTIININANDKH